MNWIKVSDALPLAGKEVLAITEHVRGDKSYGLGYLCCRDGWKLDNMLSGKVIMWAELPAIEPE